MTMESNETSAKLPPLPARNDQEGSTLSATGSKGLGIGISPQFEHGALENNEDLLSVLNKRQLEMYGMPVMNESSDIFAVKSLTTETIRHKIDEVLHEDNDKYWKQILLKDSREEPFGHVNQDERLKMELVQGIPANIRGIVYMKLFNVRYQLTKDRYQNLLKKAQAGDTTKVDTIKDEKIRNAIKVFNYYLTEVLSSSINKLDIINNTSNDSEIISSNVTELSVSLIQRFGHILDSIPTSTDHLKSEEVFYILLKLNKLISNWNLSELIYEINRSLEDLASESSVHITKQGIQLSELIKRELHDFFCHESVDNTVLIQILDWIIFYGFPVLCQVFVYLFQRNSEKINSLNNEQLAKYLFSEEFYGVLEQGDLFETITKLEPAIIKYENEYYLIYLNSLNNNNNELINAKEINEELNKTINHLHSEINNLSSTHDEILSQQAAIEQDISKNQMKNDELSKKHSELQAKFNQLTMKDNLTNTIKANKEFSDRNAELQAQIDQLKQSVQSKQEKLTKYEQAPKKE